MPHTFSYRRRIEFADTDAAGVAHFTALFRFMEEAEHAFYRSLGSSAYRPGPEGVEGMPRVAASCEFLRPVRYPEEIEVRLVVRAKTARSIDYEAEFLREAAGGATELVARGRMKVVNVRRAHDGSDWTAVPLPAALRDGIEVAPEEGGP